jgi:hypothetical protein
MRAVLLILPSNVLEVSSDGDWELGEPFSAF